MKNFTFPLKQPQILEALSKLECLQTYKLVKSRKWFYKKEGFLKKTIELKLLYKTRPAYINELYIKVSPILDVRFSFLHDWLEEFVNLHISFYREMNTWGIAFESNYIFDSYDLTLRINDLSSFEEDLKKFENWIKNYALPYLETHSKLSYVYHQEIIPLLKDLDKYYCNGIKYFEILAIVKIVAPDKLPESMNIIRAHMEMLNSSGDPNVEDYLPIFDKIIQKLEGMEFKEAEGYI